MSEENHELGPLIEGWLMFFIIQGMFLLGMLTVDGLIGLPFQK